MVVHAGRRVAAAVAGALMALGGSGPTVAAPSPTAPSPTTAPSPSPSASPGTGGLAEALKLQAEVAEALGRPSRAGAVAASGGSPGGSSIAAGDTSSCSAGVVFLWCWGDNAAGQLGDGTTASAVEPVEATAGASLRDVPFGAVAAGRAHTCGVSIEDSGESGDLYCWGDGTEGQLGDGDAVSRPAPVRVTDGVRQVAAGADHTCAVTDDATVSCWGRNDKGQVGGTGGAVVPDPRPVPGLTDVADISAGGDTTCAVVEDGDAFCWGSDASGQLGNGGGAADSATPVAVAVADAAERFTQVVVGGRHACAVTEGGLGWCWGDDTAGQLGDGDSTGGATQPVAVSVDSIEEPLYSISAGGDSSCAITVLGMAYCWGDNAQGQLGTGDRNDRDEPAAVDHRNVASLFGVADDRRMLQDISIGAAHVCALDVPGNAYCWGDNAEGQIGDGTSDDALVPVPTTLLPGQATGVGVTPGDRRLDVTWVAPADTGAADLVGYFALAISEEEGGSLSSVCKDDSRSCRIEELTNGVDYAVLVATSTRGGLSFSDPVTGRPVALSSPVPAPGGGGGLPITGVGVTLVVAAGGALILLGMLVVRLARRRHA